MNIILEYVWIDGYNNVRTKIKIHPTTITSMKDIPVWNFDGSSTNQATTETSEVLLYPVQYYKCPFRKNSKSFIVLCTTSNNNNRENAVDIFLKYKDYEAWYGLEQEYFIYENNMPVGYIGGPHTKHYCSIGENDNRVSRIMEEHMIHCLYMGIKISGINMEVAPGQCEFQIGPETGIKVSDDLWIARFILQKVASLYNLHIVYHPKPIQNDYCNGSGCHTNFSTKDTRKENGYNTILEYISRLEKKHSLHIEKYGIDNKLRLTGKNETSSISAFSYSIGGRDCSIRIGFDTFNNNCGYFEDRRPASNMDPYIVCPLLLETCIGDSSY